MTLPALVLLGLCAEPLLEVLYGEGFGAYATLLLILLIGPAIRVAMGMPGVVLQMTGQARVVAILNLSLAALGVPALAGAAGWAGLLAVAWATVLLHGIRAVGLTVLCWRRVGSSHTRLNQKMYISKSNW